MSAPRLMAKLAVIVTDEMRRAHALYCEGHTYSEIARLMGHTDKTVKDWVKRVHEANRAERLRERLAERTRS